VCLFISSPNREVNSWIARIRDYRRLVDVITGGEEAKLCCDCAMHSGGGGGRPRSVREPLAVIHADADSRWVWCERAGGLRLESWTEARWFFNTHRPLGR